MAPDSPRIATDRRDIEAFVTAITKEIKAQLADKASPLGHDRTGTAARRAMALWALRKKLEELFDKEWPWPELGRPGEPTLPPEKPPA